MLRPLALSTFALLVGCSDVERPTPPGGDTPETSPTQIERPVVADPGGGAVEPGEPGAAVPTRDGDTPTVADEPDRERPPAEPRPPERQAPAQREVIARRPATIQETISVEGVKETVTFRLVSFRDVRLPFSTYVRDGWTGEASASHEGESVQMAFGEPSRQAAVHLFVPSGSPTAAEVTEMAREVASSRGQVTPLDADAWSSGGFAFLGNGQIGQVRVGKHAGVAFYIIGSFAPDMADGFFPASRVSVERWRWLDDGTGL